MTTCTHRTTDLGLWWPYTDQGKTPWRVKPSEWEKRLSMRKKPIQMNSVWIPIGAYKMYSTANDMREWNVKKKERYN